MHTDLADVARVAEADVSPGETGVGRLVDAIAVCDVDANGRLASPRVDDVAVGGSDGQRTDRRGLEESVADVLPELAGVVRLPHAAGDGTEVEHRLLLGGGGDSHHASTAARTDAAISDLGEELRINGGHDRILPPMPRGWTTARRLTVCCRHATTAPRTVLDRGGHRVVGLGTAGADVVQRRVVRGADRAR